MRELQEGAVLLSDAKDFLHSWRARRRPFPFSPLGVQQSFQGSEAEYDSQARGHHEAQGSRASLVKHHRSLWSSTLLLSHNLCCSCPFPDRSRTSSALGSNSSSEEHR